MISLRKVLDKESKKAFSIIETAKEFLKEQGIDQWQKGYPDFLCIENDCKTGKGYFIVEDEVILGYVCIDFDGEKAYDDLNGSWSCDEDYVVIHRLAFTKDARGKNISQKVFLLVEELSKSKNIHYFRVDTDGDNKIMQKTLKKVGFDFKGTIWFDNSEKIAFDKIIKK